MNERIHHSRVLDDIIHSVTGGRPYVFVIMAYGEGHAVYEQIESEIKDMEKDCGIRLSCLRADDVPLAGLDLLEKIHILIERAQLVIAEISPRKRKDFSPNVYYEVGYAVAKRKDVLLLAKKGTKIPTDLKGLEVIDHHGNGTAEQTKLFRDSLHSHVRNRLNPGTGLLRDMLQATNPKPALIVASPKYPGKHSRIQGQLYDRRTFGDNLGIVGLLSVFGKVFGEHGECELISALHTDVGPLVRGKRDQEQPIRGLAKQDVNLYLIGSKKVNELSGIMLAEIVKHGSPGWYLGADSKEKEQDDYEVCLFEVLGDGTRRMIKGKKGRTGRGEVHTEDHGIVIRAPHPKHRDRLVVIMAGPHSLGTGAACIAATRTAKIREIRDKLPTEEDRIAFADHTRTVWALVHGKADDDDGMLSEDNVSILRSGIYSAT